MLCAIKGCFFLLGHKGCFLFCFYWSVLTRIKLNNAKYVVSNGNLNFPVCSGLVTEKEIKGLPESSGMRENIF